MQRSKLALAAGIFGAVGLFDPGLGAALAHFGVLEPMQGFLLFGLGLLSALIAGVLGLAALYATRAAARRSGSKLAILGIAAALVAFAIIGLARQPGAGVPPINDISTDLSDPPAFASDPAGRGRDMSYPADFVPQVRAAYPDLAPIRVSSDPDRALALAEETARALGWDVVAVDPAAGTLLARETTRIFRFVDDVVVRMRPAEGGGSIVDVRSKSRDGQGDLGVNAVRIRSLTVQLAAN